MPAPVDHPKPDPTPRGWYAPWWIVLALLAAIIGTPLVLAAWVMLTGGP